MSDKYMHGEERTCKNCGGKLRYFCDRLTLPGSWFHDGGGNSCPMPCPFPKPRRVMGAQR